MQRTVEVQLYPSWRVAWGAPPPVCLDRGVHEVPFSLTPGGRLYVSMDDDGLAVAWAEVEAGGSSRAAVVDLRAGLAARSRPRLELLR